ncbi:hypothetical protein GCM10027089_05050 [Nocardia thraciensis]
MPARGPARGPLAHLDARSAPAPSSLVRVRRQRHHGRTPILLPTQIQAILDGCAVVDPATGDWAGDLPGRLLFASPNRMRLRGEAAQPHCFGYSTYADRVNGLAQCDSLFM